MQPRGGQKRENGRHPPKSGGARILSAYTIPVEGGS